MFQENRWPYIPTRLSEILEPDMLAVIEAGCSARLGRAITILDYDPRGDTFTDRIESIGGERAWAEFCRLFRTEQDVPGGDAACQACDRGEARNSLDAFRIQHQAYRPYLCHMGVLDATHIIRVNARPVALLYTGQHRPDDGVEGIRARVDALGTGKYADILPTEAARIRLRALADALPAPVADFPAKLEREAALIEHIAEATFVRRKYNLEQSFLDDLRETPAGGDDLESIRRSAERLLEKVQAFCRCRYAAFFASIEMGHTVLPAIAWTGIAGTRFAELPHFNWRKAGLNVGQLDAEDWLSNPTHQAASRAAIRGEHNRVFADAGACIPVAIGDKYRGLLAFGPFDVRLDLTEEGRFLATIANAVGSHVLTALELRFLEQERNRWESASHLLTHQLRTGLTPISTTVGRAKAMARRCTGDEIAARVVEMLSRAEDLTLRLAETSRQTLEGNVLQVERSDMEFERYPLAALVGNVAHAFSQRAEAGRRQIVVDRGVELLPEAEVDVARLTIVLGNLLDNAIKYSYPGTTIHVRGNTSEISGAIIEVDDLGEEIREEDREHIFEQGRRALTRAKLGRIPGKGLGLWEARAVIDAHGGEIGVYCQPTGRQRGQGAAFHVTFSVRIPLRQKAAKGRI
jgi:signal transduction histidine kinase